MEKLNNYVLRWISDSIDLSDIKTKVRKLKKSDDYFINFNYTMMWVSKVHQSLILVP